MIDRVAFVPHPPALLPGATGRPVAEVERLRVTAGTAVQWVLDSAPDVLVLLGDASATREWPAGTRLPLSLDVASTLLLSRPAASTAPGPVLSSIRADASPADCRAAGVSLAARGPRVGLVAAGDGSARRSETGPGHLDARAASFDAGVQAALTDGDPQRLAGIDAGLGDALLAAGPRVWHVTAAAIGSVPLDRQIDTDIDYAAAPYGVFYVVARWTVRARTSAAGS